MTRYPQAIKNLIERLAMLPGIGPKAAERLAFALLQRPINDIEALSNALKELKSSVVRCSRCNTYSEVNPCSICRDNQRAPDALCIVARPQDIYLIERTGEYRGLYHVLGGVIDTLGGVLPEQLTIAALLNRVKLEPISEVIFALSPDIPGETTMLYLTKALKSVKQVRVTRLAQGLPSGSDLEYVDDVTLSKALKSRSEV